MFSLWISHRFASPRFRISSFSLCLIALLAIARAQAAGFAPSAPMSAARYEHTATLLPNGKILVVGGFGPGTLNSVELYNPATNTWSTAASLGIGRALHTATLL